jgi:hypothetical protein
LLLFFHRHPHVLLTGDQLARYVGHDMQQVATSLDRLILERLVSKSQHATHPARMYLLAAKEGNNDPLGELLDLASTPDGRRTVLRALRAASGDPRGASEQGTDRAPVRLRSVR